MPSNPTLAEGLLRHRQVRLWDPVRSVLAPFGSTLVPERMGLCQVNEEVPIFP
jgi:hypothetical protein